MSEDTLDTWDHAELQMLHTYHLQSLQTLVDQTSFINATSNHQGIQYESLIFKCCLKPLIYN